MKKFIVLTAMMMAALVGCKGTDNTLKVLHQNRILIETSDSMVVVLEEGISVAIANIKGINDGPVTPAYKGAGSEIKEADIVYFEVQTLGEKPGLLCAGRVVNGHLKVVEVSTEVKEELANLCYFQRGKDTWALAYVIKMTSKKKPAPAPANNNSVTPPANNNSVTPPAPAPTVGIKEITTNAGRELTATVVNLPPGASPTFQWFELDDKGAYTAIAGATTPKYTAVPGIAEVKFKVKVSFSGKDYEAEAVVKP